MCPDFRYNLHHSLSRHFQRNHNTPRSFPTPTPIPFSELQHPHFKSWTTNPTHNFVELTRRCDQTILEAALASATGNPRLSNNNKIKPSTLTRTQEQQRERAPISVSVLSKDRSQSFLRHFINVLEGRLIPPLRYLSLATRIYRYHCHKFPQSRPRDKPVRPSEAMIQGKDITWVAEVRES